MSFPYRVSVKASVSEAIRGRQESRRQITLELPLVPKERLREKLLAELVRRGFAPEGAEGALVRRREEIVERVDPQTLVASSAIEGEGRIEGTLETSAASGSRKAAPRVERAARARLEREIRESGRDRFERELSARVDAAGRELERDLNEAIGRVYVEAMEERARGLGEVESVKESRVGDDIVLEIKITVSD